MSYTPAILLGLLFLNETGNEIFHVIASVGETSQRILLTALRIFLFRGDRKKQFSVEIQRTRKRRDISN